MVFDVKSDEMHMVLVNASKEGTDCIICLT